MRGKNPAINSTNSHDEYRFMQVLLVSLTAFRLLLRMFKGLSSCVPTLAVNHPLMHSSHVSGIHCCLSCRPGRCLNTTLLSAKQSNLIPAPFLKDGKLSAPLSYSSPTFLLPPTGTCLCREFPHFGFCFAFFKAGQLLLVLGFIFCTASRVHLVFSRGINENGCRERTPLSRSQSLP